MQSGEPERELGSGSQGKNDLPERQSPVIGPDGTVYVITASPHARSYDNEWENLRIMAIRDGSEAWSRRLEYSGISGPEIKAHGDLHHVSRTVTKDYETNLLNRIRGKEDKSSFMDCLEILGNDNTVRHYAPVIPPRDVESFSAHFYIDNSPLPFGIAPDGSACKMRDHGTAQGFSPEGRPTWAFTFSSRTLLCQGEKSEITADLVYDREGNLYLTGYHHDDTANGRWITRIVKLDGTGTLQYDCIVPGMCPELITPVVTDRGELVVVTHEPDKYGKGVQHVLFIGTEGEVRRDIKADPGFCWDNGFIQNIMPGAEGEVLLERLGQGKRAVLGISARPLKESVIEASEKQEDKIEVTDREIIIDDVRMPIHEWNIASAR